MHMAVSGLEKPPLLSLLPGEQALHLAISHALPGIDDADDSCISRFTERMKAQRGISEAHLEEQGDQTVLCLHYDPNLVPLERVERIARDTGVEITTRFRHETLPLLGMDHGTSQANIELAVQAIPGVLSVGVSYPIEKMKVEYDSTLTNHEVIAQVVRSLGFQFGEPTPKDKDKYEGHHHAEVQEGRTGSEETLSCPYRCSLVYCLASAS